jgi:hypothetical protein
VKLCTQAIKCLNDPRNKNYFNLKEKNMIPNIKSSEGIGDGVLKSYTCGLRVYHVQRASGNPVRIPVQIISQRNCILDSVTERNNSRKIINGELLASDLYIIKEGTEFSGSGFNADYDLNWLSNVVR